MGLVGMAKTEKERAAIHKRNQYRERAKRLRPFFKDVFTASEGFDLRSPDKWTPAQKAKVTKYFRVMAPHITGDFVVKRYRRPDNKKAALEASMQERPLKGQTAVAFRKTDTREALRVTVKDGVANVVRSGVEQISLDFNRKAFMRDPDAEIDRALAKTDANVFRIQTGAFAQLKTLTRSEVKAEIARLIKQYSPENIRRDQGQRPFDDWLNGLIAYPGTKKKTYTKVQSFVRRQERQAAKNEIARLDRLSKERGGKGYSRTIDEQVKMRRKRKGR